MQNKMRYYFFHVDGTWSPVTKAVFEDSDGDEAPVSVEELENGAFRLHCGIYYSPYGYLQFEVTQPLDRALQMFGALLAVDAVLETHRGKPLRFITTAYAS